MPPPDQPQLSADQQQAALEYIQSYTGTFRWLRKMRRLLEHDYELSPAELLGALHCQQFDTNAQKK